MNKVITSGFDVFAPAGSSSCVNNPPPTNSFDVDPDSLAPSYSFTCVQVNTAVPSAAPNGASSAPVVSKTPTSGGGSSSSSSSCFSAQSTLQLESGELIAISDASVGDMVLVSSIDGQSTSFKSIVSVPHDKNSIESTFLEITTQTGKTLQVTPDHLVMGGKCSSTEKSALLLASSLTVSDCVHTVNGQEEIVSIKSFVSQGVYTVVTESADDLLVVNQVIASPFSGNHQVANAFYNIVRLANKVFPSVMKLSLLRRAVALFGDIAVSV